MMFRVDQRNRDFFSKHKDLPWILASVLLLYVFVCTFPVVYEPLGTGLDESWKFALTSLRSSNTYVFGRDISFTYGPLGYLLTPAVFSGGASSALPGAFWVALNVSLFTVVWFRLRRQAGGLALFVGSYLCLCAVGMWSEYRVAFIICALCLSSLEGTYTAMISAGLASLFAALTPEIKSSLGLASLSFLLGSWVVLGVQRSRSARRNLVVGVATFVVALLTLQLVLFRTLKHWTSWITASSEIMRGYSSAMSISGENTPLVLALLAFLAAFSLLFVLTPATRRCMIPFAPLTLIAFKEGFVRQDGHRFIFFLAIAMIPALLLLSPGGSRGDRSRLTMVFVVTYAIAICYSASFQAFPALRTEDIGRYIRMTPGGQNLYALFRPLEAARQMRAVSNDALKPDLLPPEWRRTIGNSTVSILPWEISIAAANNLNWQPLPTLQLYNAYTGRLDRITSDGIRDRGAKYLLVDFIEIDGRNLVLDDPLTWRSITQQYDVSALDPSSQRLLLSRKAASEPRPELESVSENEAVFDRWVDLPTTSYLLYASIKVENSTVGRVAEIFYHVPALYVQLQRVSGRTTAYRVLPKTASNGMLINYVPETGFDLSELIQESAADPVVRFRITDSGARSFFKRHYTWKLLADKKAIRQVRPLQPPPLISEVMPSVGMGRSASLEITTSSSAGVASLDFVQVLVNKDLNGVKACYVSYEVPNKRLWLISDRGQGAAGVGQPGDPQVLENSQCRIALDRAKPYVTNNSIKLKLDIQFQPAFSGKRQIFVYAKDRSGSNTNWQSRAEWQVN